MGIAKAKIDIRLAEAKVRSIDRKSYKLLEIKKHNEEQERERERVKKDNLIHLIDLLMRTSHIYSGYKYGKW